MTVWGKLSWGADPLTASSPQDGIADGSRISPSAPFNLSITVSHLYVTHLKTGQGYAAQFQLYAGSTATGTPELTNYSAPVGLSGGISLLTGYTVVLPSSQTSQFETLQIEVLVNESGSSTLTAVPFDGTLKQVDVTYDMVHGALVSEAWSNTTGNPNGSLALSLSTVPLDRKTPTYLWLPGRQFDSERASTRSRTVYRRAVVRPRRRQRVGLVDFGIHSLPLGWQLHDLAAAGTEQSPIPSGAVPELPVRDGRIRREELPVPQFPSYAPNIEQRFHRAESPYAVVWICLRSDVRPRGVLAEPFDCFRTRELHHRRDRGGQLQLASSSHDGRGNGSREQHRWLGQQSVDLL